MISTRVAGRIMLRMQRHQRRTILVMSTVTVVTVPRQVINIRTITIIILIIVMIEKVTIVQVNTTVAAHKIMQITFTIHRLLNIKIIM